MTADVTAVGLDDRSDEEVHASDFKLQNPHDNARHTQELVISALWEERQENLLDSLGHPDVVVF